MVREEVVPKLDGLLGYVEGVVVSTFMLKSERDSYCSAIVRKVPLMRHVELRVSCRADVPSEDQMFQSIRRYCRKSCSFEMKKGGVSC